MARPLRIQYSGAIYHLMSRGDRRQDISNPHERGDAAAGKNAFRFETCGNEGFWTDAARTVDQSRAW
jgi:hypothetical protein